MNNCKQVGKPELLHHHSYLAVTCFGSSNLSSIEPVALLGLLCSVSSSMVKGKRKAKSKAMGKVKATAKPKLKANAKSTSMGSADAAAAATTSMGSADAAAAAATTTTQQRATTTTTTTTTTAAAAAAAMSTSVAWYGFVNALDVGFNHPSGRRGDVGMKIVVRPDATVEIDAYVNIGR